MVGIYKRKQESKKESYEKKEGYPRGLYICKPHFLVRAHLKLFIISHLKWRSVFPSLNRLPGFVKFEVEGEGLLSIFDLLI